MLPKTLLQKFDELIARYLARRSALIPMLLATQEEFGYVTPDSIQFISSYLGIPEIEVHEVITFYSMLRTRPVGKHHIQVCTNISCMLRGGDDVMDYLSKQLGIKEGEVTHDALFSLSEVECLGACANAPAMQIDYQYHENLTKEKVDLLLKDLKESPPCGKRS